MLLNYFVRFDFGSQTTRIIDRQITTVIMGKKKFIDKKSAVSFVLEPSGNSGGGSDGGKRATASADGNAPPALVEQPSASAVASAVAYDRREWELGEYGFPSSGR